MAKDQLKDLHLFAIESALPFGMGIINNAKAGGLKKIINVFKSKDPVLEFLVDGKTSAKVVRDKMDQLIPGLGHPVVSVDVSVEKNYSDDQPNDEQDDQDSLVLTLNRIDSQLDQLRSCLDNVSKDVDDNSVV